MLLAQLQLPLLTRAMLAGGRGAGVLLLALAAGVAFGVPWARRRWRADAALRLRLDRWLFSVPVLGGGWRNLASLRFVRVLGLLLERGVGLIESVPMAGRASGSAWLADCARRETEAMGEGKPLVETDYQLYEGLSLLKGRAIMAERDKKHAAK